MVNKKETRKKRSEWSPNEVALLLRLWEERLPQLRSKRNYHVYADVAVQLAARGFNFSSVEVKVKIHNLTNKYREEKKKANALGSPPSNWEYFLRLNRFLGGNKSFNLEPLDKESTG